MGGIKFRVGKNLRARLLSGRHAKWRHNHARKQNGLCFYCDRPFRDKPDWAVATLDHKIPLSRDGIDHFENTVAACASCNTKKQDMTDEEFFMEMKA